MSAVDGLVPPRNRAGVIALLLQKHVVDVQKVAVPGKEDGVIVVHGCVDLVDCLEIFEARAGVVQPGLGGSLHEAFLSLDVGLFVGVSHSAPFWADHGIGAGALVEVG